MDVLQWQLQRLCCAIMSVEEQNHIHLITSSNKSGVFQSHTSQAEFYWASSDNSLPALFHYRMNYVLR